MNENDKMPTSRFERTGRFIRNRCQEVGRNYLKCYSQKFSGRDDPKVLQEENAQDIYKTLSQLKGGALKVAQMMSLDQGLLPEAFSRQFAQSQYSAPPLSYPLVVQTFRKSLGKTPTELFEKFSQKAVAAASIGQVRQAEQKGEKAGCASAVPRCSR
ncbi:MAG: AarF/UbiB family protein [Owenweeksia sp.]|nr:AarF/UbiB family protein [Owenweeksia sp.]